MQKYQKGRNPNTLANLKDTTAPDSPGETEPITVRVRVDQKEWLDTQQQSRSYLIRQALDLYLVTLEKSE